MSRAAWDPIGRSVLSSGVDDWVDLVGVVSFVREHDARLSERDALPRATAVVRSLMREGLVRIGEVTGQGFAPWPGDLAEVEQRLDRAVREVTLPLRFGDVGWLENTPLGNEYGTGGAAEFQFATPGQAPIGPKQRERILTYLRGGAPLPGGYRTDGEWIWPERLCRDLEEHGVPPEPELVARIEELGYYCPPVTTQTATAAGVALARARASDPGPDVGSVP